MATNGSAKASTVLRSDRVVQIGITAAVVFAIILTGLVLVLRSPPSETVRSDQEAASVFDLKVVDPNDGDCRLQPLSFDALPLPEVVDMINRCNGPILIVEDDALRGIRVSGRIRTGNPETFVEILEHVGIVNAATRADGTIALRGIDSP
ncbi:MAG: hypothetical protein AAGE85_03820 [Pseudomonadota bacterium]